MRRLWLDRVVVIVLAVATMIAFAPTEVRAKHWRHVARHQFVRKPVQFVQPADPPQTASLGSTRYYGCPKSPMWRGPVEN